MGVCDRHGPRGLQGPSIKKEVGPDVERPGRLPGIETNISPRRYPAPSTAVGGRRRPRTASGCLSDKKMWSSMGQRKTQPPSTWRHSWLVVGRLPPVPHHCWSRIDPILTKPKQQGVHSERKPCVVCASAHRAVAVERSEEGFRPGHGLALTGGGGGGRDSSLYSSA